MMSMGLALWRQPKIPITAMTTVIAPAAMRMPAPVMIVSPVMEVNASSSTITQIPTPSTATPRICN